MAELILARSGVKRPGHVSSGAMSGNRDSVVVVGDVYTLAGRRDDVIALLRDTQERIRPQPGCVSFSFAEVVGDPGHYLVVEEWSDDAALRTHFRSDAFTSYQENVGELLARPSEVRIHRVSETTRPVDSGPLDPRRAD
jgi:quinol monooxygenase YgiN